MTGTGTEIVPVRFAHARRVNSGDSEERWSYRYPDANLTGIKPTLEGIGDLSVKAWDMNGKFVGQRYLMCGTPKARCRSIESLMQILYGIKP